MNFVWFTSFLCVFMLGGIASLFAAYLTINHMANKEEKKLREAAGVNTLSEKLAPYGVKDPFLN